MAENSFRQFVQSHKWYQHFNFLENYGVRGQMDCAEKWQLLQLPRDFKGKSVLDLGCNRGWYSFAAKHHGAGKVVGVDVSRRNIEAAKFIRDKIYNRVYGVDFVVADIEKAAFEEKFDYVFLLAALHRIGDTQPPHVAPIERQLKFLDKVCGLVNETLVLEFYPDAAIHEEFLLHRFSFIEDLGESVSPDSHPRRILKCHEPL